MDYVSEALLNAEQALKNSDDKEDIIQHYERYYMEMKFYTRDNYYFWLQRSSDLQLFITC